MNSGRRLAIVVGVSRYLNGYTSLRYAGADALKIATAFQNSGYQVQVLATDTEMGAVRRQAVLAAFQEVVMQAREEDTILFYFSGHGSRQGGRDYLLLSDADPRHFEETALPLDTLGELLAKCRAHQRLFIVDACRDAGLAQPSTRAKGINGFTKGGLPRGFQEKVGYVAQKAPARIPVRWAALFACSPNQFAKESDDERSGVFTTRLLEALGGGLGGEVTIEAAQRYIQDKMPRSLQGVQRPDSLGERGLSLAAATPNLVPYEGSGFVIMLHGLAVRFRLSGLVPSHIRTEYISGGNAPEGALDQNYFYSLETMHPKPFDPANPLWQEWDDNQDVLRRRISSGESMYQVDVLRRERPDVWLLGSRWRISIYVQGKLDRPALVREWAMTSTYVVGTPH